MKNKFSDITILIDIDDTIECLGEAWISWLNQKYGTSVLWNDITDWNVNKFFPLLTKEQVYEPLNEPDFWKNVKPKQGAVEYVKKLQDDGFKIYLCTSTDYRNIKPKYEEVIQKYFPYIEWKQIIVTSNKQMIEADFLVDDGVHNLKGGKFVKILMDAPHNRNFNAEENDMFRVKDWETTYSLIKTLSYHISNRGKYF